ncbi:hypothetical protein DXV76_04280 [Rhodobacteraceae bacterium CCMM004]|nr:hypothetical protein DXV76_04280 [Rhodobacteraceae bacterium CCMM004]
MSSPGDMRRGSACARACNATWPDNPKPTSKPKRRVDGQREQATGRWSDSRVGRSRTVARQRNTCRCRDLRRAQEFLEAGDPVSAEKCRKLNYVLHNSSLPNSVKLGKGARFAYGGIGIIVHHDCEIPAHACIGSDITLGGTPGSPFRLTADRRRLYVPLIDEHAFVATGACILGGVTVGKMAIVGANAVVLKDVPPLAIVAGQPAKVVSKITPDNALKYRGTFAAFRDKSQSEYIEFVASLSDECRSPSEIAP